MCRINFDKKQALSFEGNSGPYLQYTHARTVSVLKKAQQIGITVSTVRPPKLPYAIEYALYHFPEVIFRARTEDSPHYLVSFLSEIAGMYNTFYASERIADSTDSYAPYNVAITDAVRITLARGLFLLGIEAPDAM